MCVCVCVYIFLAKLCFIQKDHLSYANSTDLPQWVVLKRIQNIFHVYLHNFNLLPIAYNMLQLSARNGKTLPLPAQGLMGTLYFLARLCGQLLQSQLTFQES